ncbi:mechanosensitive ion channel [Saccharopolyspora taberi]|uniref:Transporter (Transmembrane protein) n=1 Tax=Saccharopolyspora taberi TaxID=60895 RepID=A0ABN3V9R2_9PSEU
MALAQGGLGQSLLAGLQAVIQYIPTLIGALIVLLVGYLVAKVVQKLVEKGLHKVGVDRRMRDTPVGRWIDQAGPGASPSRAMGKVAFWLIFLVGLVSAIGALGIAAITAFMNQVLAYVPNIIAAIAIFVIAGMVAGAVGRLAGRTMTGTTGRIAATVGPVLVMGIAVFMILTQLGIAPAIVQITYTALMGAIALGLALAFGLGGREIAAEMLRAGYNRTQEEQPAGAGREEMASRAAAEDKGWSTTSPGQGTTEAQSTSAGGGPGSRPPA